MLYFSPQKTACSLLSGQNKTKAKINNKNVGGDKLENQQLQVIPS